MTETASKCPFLVSRIKIRVTKPAVIRTMMLHFHHHSDNRGHSSKGILTIFMTINDHEHENKKTTKKTKKKRSNDHNQELGVL